MIDYKAFGDRIRTERKNSGKTQQGLADAIGVSPAFLGHLEHGRRTISLETLVALCNELRISPNYLFHGMVLDDETKQPLAPAFWENSMAAPRPDPVPAVARCGAAHPDGLPLPPFYPAMSGAQGASACSLRENMATPAAIPGQPVKNFVCRKGTMNVHAILHAPRPSVRPAHRMRSPAAPALVRESFSSLDQLSGRTNDEERPLRKIVYLDEHLHPDQLAELHKLMSGWVCDAPPHPSQPPIDLLCLVGPWGCAQLPLFSLHGDMSLLDPASPRWSPEAEVQYLTELLNQAAVPAAQPFAEELARMQRLTGRLFEPPAAPDSRRPKAENPLKDE